MSDDVMIAVDPHKASNAAVVLDPVTRTLIETARFADSEEGYALGGLCLQVGGAPLGGGGLRCRPGPWPSGWSPMANWSWTCPRARRNDSTIARPLRLEFDTVESTTGWALTDSAAAVAYEAPLAVRADQPLDFYVPDQVTARRAVALLGGAPSRSQARCAVRVAPVPAACSHRVSLATNPFEWPLAHPLFVALDLAQDAGRGREILDAWTPPERWTRAW